MAVKLEFQSESGIVTPGGTITVTASSQSIAGNVVRAATDLANALGCDLEVRIDPDLGRISRETPVAVPAPPVPAFVPRYQVTGEADKT